MTRTRIGIVTGGAVAAGLLAAWLSGLLGGARPAAPDHPPDDGTAPGLPRFEDVATRAGVGFRHFDPATPRHLIPETMGSGVAWIDYDADGWPDLFCVQAGPLPPARVENPPTHRLYRNNRDGTFADVTEAAGLNAPGFGMGVAVGDFDNDGFDDLVVTDLGGLTLYHNQPDGRGGRRFVDVTAAAGLSGTNPHWGTGCAWGDLDGDGLLDLYVCNYVEIDPANPLVCRDAAKPIYHTCPPTAYPVTTHRLYRNLGGGQFRDVSAESGVAAARPAAGLAVAVLDLDGDGRPDVFVANDLFSAYLFHNQTPPGGPIALVEKAWPSGCALGPDGVSMSGMCAELADVDGSGRPAVFVTNFQDQPNVLFKNLGGLQFRDATAASGLGPASRPKLGFGAAFLDADLDGNPDLAVANGHVYRTAPELRNVAYAQEAQLFLGDGTGRFRDATRSAGRDFTAPRVGRGLARGDFDNDGKPDLVMSAVGGPVALFRNKTDTPNAWVGLELVGDGKGSNRNAVGAVVTVEAGGKKQTHFVAGGGSYLSAHDRRLTVGLGPATRADRVTVRWPSGRTQEFRDLAAGRYWRLHEGQPGAG
jgi:hypothetical protein